MWPRVEFDELAGQQRRARPDALAQIVEHAGRSARWYAEDQ
ncbi:MAG TPA: hypothetical protein VGJ63_06015 [Micromonosporaceae bacterium]